MFTSAGNKKVKLGSVAFADPKFSKAAGAFDICIRVTDVSNDAESDWARLEMSSDYGKGNFANRTQAEITMDTLRKLGFEGEDLTTLEEQLLEREAVVHVKESKGREGDKTFYNVQYFVTGGGNEPEAIAVDEMKRRLAMLMGGARGSTATAQPTGVGGTATAPAAAGSIPPPRIAAGNNPFARKAS